MTPLPMRPPRLPAKARAGPGPAPARAAGVPPVPHGAAAA